MVDINQISSVVSNYLSYGDAERFVLEFSKLSYNIHKHGEPDAIELANSIESKMADLRSGLISKPEFSDFLSNLVNPFVTNFSVPVMTYQLPGSFNFSGAPGMETLAWAGLFGTTPAVESESEPLARR
jgi:hypothetical protein